MSGLAAAFVSLSGAVKHIHFTIESANSSAACTEQYLCLQRYPAALYRVKSLTLHLCSREKQEYEQLEGKIDGLSSNKAALEQKLSQLAGNGEKYEEMLQISQRLAALVAEIDSQTERWLELADRAEQHSASVAL